MTRERRRTSDPREAGGAAVGPGGPHDRGQITYDARRMILVEQAEVSIAHGTSRGKPLPDRVAMVLNGRINRPPDDEIAAERPVEPVSYLNMMDWSLAADLVANLFALAGRDGTGERFEKQVEARWDELREQGFTRKAPQ